MDDHPRIRGVEAFPVHHEGRDFVALRDPAGYASGMLLLSRDVIEVVARFDGRRSFVDIQAELTRERGELVLRADLERVAAMLDEHGFLDSPRFAARRRAVEEAFLASPVRPAAHAGGAYPGDPDALRAIMTGFFDPPAGPGKIGTADAAAPEGAGRAPQPDGFEDGTAPVRGVVAPHIDFHRGGPAYAWAYRDVGERASADVYVIFGTCHAGMRDPFALTRKAYETPLGTVPVDQDFVDQIVGRAREDLFGSEAAHRIEHSIEFQALFLQYLFGGRRTFTIVPVLTSFAHEALARGQSPEADPRVRRVLDAIAETAAASGRRVTYVAGADLAHMGPRFGDPTPLDPGDMARLAEEDRAMLRAVEEGSPRGFFESVAADGDRRRICGLSPIWSLLHVLDGRAGAVRHYGQTPDPACVVTFASVVFP